MLVPGDSGGGHFFAKLANVVWRASLQAMSLQKIMMGLFAVVLFSSCQTSLKPSGYLGAVDSKMTKNKKLPFSRSWKKPGADLSSYTKIAVRPIRTEGLRELDGMAKVNARNVSDLVLKDAKSLAGLGTKEMHGQFGSSPNRQVFVSGKPLREKGLMLVETNLVELEPGRPSMQFLNFFVPFTTLLNRHAIGIEGRLVDAKSGEVLFAFSDLERAELSLLDIQRFSYYGVQRREMVRWAKQLRKTVEGNGKTMVRDPFPVQIVNW